MDNLSNDLEKGVLNSRRERAMAANNVGCGAYAAVWGIPTAFASMMGGSLGVGCVMWGIALAITIVLNRQIAQDKKKTAAEFDSQTSAWDQFITETLQSQNEFTPIREIRDAGADFSIAIDPQHKKWLVILPPQKVFHLYAFQDLINYELSKDGKSVVSGNSSEAFLGGLLFGAVGAAAGASASKEVKETCSELFLSITVNDPEIPLLRLNLLPGGEKSTEVEQQYAFSIAREIAAQLAYIRTNAPAGVEEPTVSSAADPYAELDRLFALKEKGAVTEEEYAQKKKEILNLH